MNTYLLTASMLLLAAAPAGPRKMSTLPKGLPPELIEAEASEKDGAVFVRFWLPQGVPTPTRRLIEKDGNEIEVTLYTMQYDRWFTVELEADGKKVQAFEVDRKKIAPKELLKLLGKRSPVVLFKDETPDPFYLHILRPGTVVFKGPRDKLTAPDPRRPTRLEK